LPSLSPTLTPTLSPTLVPYITLTPSLAPTLVPSFYPSLIIKETIKPTSITVPIISFDTKLSFANYDTTDLDEKSQTAIITATANSMNLSISFITYKGCEIQTRRRLNSFLFSLQGYNIVVSLQTNIPLQGKFSSFSNNPNTLYSLITTNLINSVNSGVFTSYLQAASLNLNITSFANSTISSVKSDEYTILIPKNDKGSTHKLDINSIIYVILFSGGIIILLLISYHCKSKDYKFSCVRNDVNLININLTENV
jgi:small nuclear ribonucleoprotein (snRNP)-like protein